MKISGMLLAMLVLSGVALAQEELTDADKALIKAVQDAGGQAMPAFSCSYGINCNAFGKK